MSQANQQQQYVYLYNQESDINLVMLENSDRIIQLLLANQTSSITFVMINQKPTYQIQLLKQNLEKQLQTQLVLYKDLQLLLTHLQQKRFTPNIVIICPPQVKSYIINNKNIECLFCFPCEQINQIQEYSHSYYEVENEQELISGLLFYKNIKQKQSFKILPNFLHLNDEVSTSNVLVQSLWSMINYKYDKITNILIVNQLQKLFKKMQKFQLTSQKFISQLKQGYLSSQRAIYWYTAQFSIYKVVNNLLRSTQNSYLLFYIQPYFQSLFNSIQKFHQKQKNKRQLTCYRGGKITQQELERFRCSAGGVVQNLGFLSTTLSKQVTIRYIENVLFQILVDEEHDSGFNFGYASIGEHSQYFAQQQVLFNPLNFFKVLCINERTQGQSKVFQIQLLFKCIPSQSIRLGEEQKLNIQMMKRQKEIQRQIKNQGDALVSFQNNQEIGLLYWQKHNQIIQTKCKQLKQIQSSIKISQQNYQRIQSMQRQYKEMRRQYNYGLIKISQYFYIKKEYEKAQLIAQDARQDLIRIKLTETTIFAQSLFILANVYSIQKKFDKSFQMYTQLQQLDYQTINNLSNIHVKIKRGLAYLYQQKKEYQVALRLYQQTLQLNQKNHSLNGNQFWQVLSGIADIYLIKSQYEKSLRFYFKAIEQCTKLYGKRHYSCAINLYSIGLIYKLKRQFKKSYTFFREGLEICQDFYGVSYSLNADFLANIGQIYQNLGLLQKASQSFQSSIKISKEYGCQKSKEYVQILLTLSRVYFSKNQLDKAFSICQKGKKIILEVQGKNNQIYVALLLSIIEGLMHKKQYDSALQIIQPQKEVIKYCKQKYKIGYAQILNCIANIYKEKGQLSKALQIFEKSLQIKRTIFGSTHFYLVNMMMNTANIYLKLHNYSKAYQMSMQAEVNIVKKYGYCSFYYAEWLSTIAYIYEGMGDIKSALIFQTDALKIKQKISGLKHIQYLNFAKRKGDLYHNMGQFGRALKIYKYILNILRGTKSSLCWVKSFIGIIQVFIQTTNQEKARKLLIENYQIKIPRKVKNKIGTKLWINKLNKRQQIVSYVDI